MPLSAGSHIDLGEILVALIRTPYLVIGQRTEEPTSCGNAEIGSREAFFHLSTLVTSALNKIRNSSGHLSPFQLHSIMQESG
jgi:hypothetical protein